LTTSRSLFVPNYRQALGRTLAGLFGACAGVRSGQAVFGGVAVHRAVQQVSAYGLKCAAEYG
jgi:hypothetical protein